MRVETAIPRKLLQGTPRRVGRRAGSGSFLEFRKLMILPRVLVGVLLLVMALSGVVGLLFGPVVTAHVDGHSVVHPGNRNKPDAFFLKVIYPDGSRIVSQNVRVDWERYGDVSDGSSIRVKVLHLLPYGQVVPIFSGWEPISLSLD